MFLCLWRSGDDGWNGLSHVPYSGKNDSSPFLAAVGPTGSIYYFIVSHGPLAKYTGKKLLFYSVILLLSDGPPGKMAQLYEQLQHPLLGVWWVVGFGLIGLFCFLLFVLFFFFKIFLQGYAIPTVVRSFLQSSGLHKILCEVLVSEDNRVCNETVLTKPLINCILVLGKGDGISRSTFFFTSTNIKYVIILFAKH